MFTNWTWRRSSALGAFVLGFLTLGCGSDGPELASVIGTVKLDGQLLKGATVEFQPDGGRPSYGTTNSDGSYEMKYTRGRPGAMLGRHTVRITTARSTEDVEGNEVAEPEKLPAKYNTETELTKEVQPGHNTFDFALTSEGT